MITKTTQQVATGTRPVITTQQDAAQAILNYFLANADAGNNAANDELVAALACHQRRLRRQQTC